MAKGAFKVREAEAVTVRQEPARFDSRARQEKVIGHLSQHEPGRERWEGEQRGLPKYTAQDAGKVRVAHRAQSDRVYRSA
jgi:hypothetical protein